MVTAAVVAGNDEDNNVRIDSRRREFPDERTDPLHRHRCAGDLGFINTNHILSRKKLSADHYVALVKSNASMRYICLLLENNPILFRHSVEDRRLYRILRVQNFSLYAKTGDRKSVV